MVHGVNSCEIEMVKEDVFIMLLDASLATGLDLSFVTHIFLPIDDAALLEQVTSRTHCFGCTGPVVVETVSFWQGKLAESKAVAKQLAASIVEEEEDNRRTSTAIICEHCYLSFEKTEKLRSTSISVNEIPTAPQWWTHSITRLSIMIFAHRRL